jgi:transcriptional regulator with XRE-family HTH domain
MSLGLILRKQRDKLHFTQQQAADLLDVSQSTYCDWESDSVLPRTENLIKISQKFDISIDELLNIVPNVNIVNSPNTISNSPHSRVETPEALLRLTESLEKLTALIEKMIQK